MPTRNPAQWQSGRKRSLGKLRRAHPASGATWNVQVVRGKMTSKCLWHACRALALGMVLMLLGAGMATVGYYANHLSIGHEIRGNATVRIRNESRGFHLNNLSYVGPIVMGFGGFIVVAACVMTFEARDSAAKVVPARFKATGSNKNNIRNNNSSATSNRRVNGITQKSSRWDQHVGVFRTSPAEKPSPTPLDRQALTAALVHFSKTIGNSPRLSPQQRRFSRSGSVPNLTSSPLRAHLSSFRKHLLLDYNLTTHRHLHHHHRHQPHSSRRLSKSRSSRIGSTLVYRESSNSLLHPTLLQLQRHALSVDESSPYSRTITDSPRNSLTSVIVTSGDGHEGRLRDRTKRSDTAKKHILARQKPIEKDEPNSPKSITDDNERRRSSATSDTSYISRQIMYKDRRTSSSRTPSIDSRSIQVELHSPEIDKISPRISRRFNSGQSSTPSVEREFRSQLSICSEPMTTRQLSGQSSLEPCVLEESPDFEEKESLSSPIENISSITKNSNTAITTTTTSTNTFQPLLYSTKKSRPDNLDLNGDHKNLKSNKINETKKFLQRSNSSRTFYRPKPRPLSEYDQIYLINSRTINNQEDFHDSLRVINERRSTILRTSESNSSEIELTNIQKNDSKVSSAQVNMTEKIPDTKNNKIVTTDIVSTNTERNDVLQKTDNDIIKKDFNESVDDELKKEQQNDNKAETVDETEQPPTNETIIVMEDN